MMNTINRKILLSILFLVTVFSIMGIMGFVSAASTAGASSCGFNVTLVNQDPNPAVPGSYVDLVFQASGFDKPDCRDVSFEVVPNYPFTIKGNETLKQLSGSTWTAGYNGVWNIPFTLGVDKDALDGKSQIEVRYYSTNNPLSYVSQRFDIDIKDSRTNFDAVIQEVSGSDVSIAIANTGKYTANSVVVRIPQQESFKATGTDGQMVGNLASGDYTIVGFSISQINKVSGLKFDIYYTDNIGERRIVNMELPVSMVSNSSLAGGYSSRTATTSTSSNYIYAIIVLVIVIVILAYKYPEIIKSFFNNLGMKSDKNKSGKGRTPEWVENAKTKGKNNER